MRRFRFPRSRVSFLVVAMGIVVIGSSCSGSLRATRSQADDVLRAIETAVRSGTTGLDDASRLPTPLLADIDNLLASFAEAGTLSSDDLARRARLREAQAALIQAQQIQATLDSVESLLTRRADDAVRATQRTNLSEQFVADFKATSEEVMKELVCELLLSSAEGRPPPPIEPTEILSGAAIARLADRWTPQSMAETIDWALWAHDIQQHSRELADSIAPGEPVHLYQVPGTIRWRAGEAYIRHCLP